MTLDQRFPCIDDLERAARRRIPAFAWQYLSGGIGRETGLLANRRALDEVQFLPQYLPDEPHNTPDLLTSLLGRDYALPFGISPLGLSGLIWPGAVQSGCAREYPHGPVSIRDHAHDGVCKTGGAQRVVSVLPDDG